MDFLRETEGRAAAPDKRNCGGEPRGEILGPAHVAGGVAVPGLCRAASCAYWRQHSPP